ncbi:MAG: UvrD-helicase domain-containing protein [Bryobacterales bacterium]
MRPADHVQRETALDPARSFIVQAPAGSGKTELLIQRYLRLLSTVEKPESVVAITFTRKAAAEMLRRVLEALADAHGKEPTEEHKRQTWALAKAVLDRDEQNDWRIEENPRRLEIQTIDALSLQLVSRMPWLSRMGPRLEMVDDATEMYAEAGLRTVALLEEERYTHAVERLLRHVDNKQTRLAKLIANMLGRREQWLRHLIQNDIGRMRAQFEQSLERGVERALRELAKVTPPAVLTEAPG